MHVPSGLRAHTHANAEENVRRKKKGMDCSLAIAFPNGGLPQGM